MLNPINPGAIRSVDGKALGSVALAVSVVGLLGLFIVLAVGFASPEVIHNAAHDVRHGMNFMCH
jgi:cobalt transporter subunit CbtB